eukprot:scaffold170769_cov28-Tisochrysis_lutea.AAC.3
MAGRKEPVASTHNAVVPQTPPASASEELAQLEACARTNDEAVQGAASTQLAQAARVDSVAESFLLLAPSSPVSRTMQLLESGPTGASEASSANKAEVRVPCDVKQLLAAEMASQVNE